MIHLPPKPDLRATHETNCQLNMHEQIWLMHDAM